LPGVGLGLAAGSALAYGYPYCSYYDPYCYGYEYAPASYYGYGYYGSPYYGWAY
jgi:hypothetical protein